MRKFDTIISKIKYDILKSVANYSFEGTLETKKDDIPYEILPGTKSTFRCCIYRERAIVFQRLRLALGKAPNDSENSRTHKEDKNALYVINTACEQCSINRFTVTENCQGCIAKKCVEACPFNAISIVNRKAYINQDLCKECGKCKNACPYNAIADQMRPCKRSCPVDAIKIDEERKAVIDYDKCIMCGRCAIGCPFGAISDKQHMVQVIDAIKSGVRVIAAIAPSIEGQFGENISLGKIKNGLKQLGFFDVYEVALGADMVALHEAHEFNTTIEERGVMTSSCCPSFTNLIKKHFPDLLDKVSDTVSPMNAIARYIKEKDGECIVVFIGPCISKKAEAAESTEGVDFVITYEELEAMLDAKEIELEKCIEEEIVFGSICGKNFAKSGGVTEAVVNAMQEMNYENSIKPIKCNGIEECKKTLKLIKSNKLEGNFIEGMACENGCIGGPCVIVNPIKSKKALEKSALTTENKSIHNNIKVNNANHIDLEK